MCGRFTIMLQVDDLREQLELGELPVELSSNRNIAPGQLVPVVTDPVTRNVALYKWGLVPSWAKDPKVGFRMFNARAETLSEKPSFREPFMRRRCLIPADGFYEWKLVGTRKYPFLFTLKDQKAFTFAGLWELWRGHDGMELRTCAIITTMPNELVVNYHDRMPVILDREARWQWLGEAKMAFLQSLLRPLDADLMAAPVKLEYISE